MSPPKNRPRRILAASLLGVLAIAGILAWQLTPPRDPILGTWQDSVPRDPFNQAYHFHADHRFTLTGFDQATGTWKLLPGPYYERRPGLTIIDDIQALRPCRYVSPAQFTPEEFKSAIAGGTYQLTAASAQVRLYECDQKPSMLGSNPDTYTAILKAGKLSFGENVGEYKRSGNWLTQAWERARSRFLP